MSIVSRCVASARVALVLASLAVLENGVRASPPPLDPPPPNFDPWLLIGGTWFGSGDPSFDYERQDGTDLDQRRLHLPADGKMYCVPTVATSALYFFAARGYSALIDTALIAPVFQAAWGGALASYMPLGYRGQTANIALMGELMDTDPQEGTSGYWEDRIVDLASARGVHDLVVAEIDDPQEPDFGLTAEALTIGVQPMLTFGRFAGADHAGERKSGHELMVSGLKLYHPPWNPSKWGYQLYYADPADNFDLKSQSPPRFESRGLRFNSALGLWCLGSKPGPSKTWSCIDELAYVFPLSLATSQLESGSTNPGGATLVVAAPVLAAGPDVPSPVLNSVALQVGTSLRDVAFERVPILLLALANGSDVVTEIDRASGRVTAVATIPGARRVVVGGRDRAAYVLGSEGITRLERSVGGTLGKTAFAATVKVAIADDVDAIGFDPIGDRVVAISAGTIRFYSAKLAPLFTMSTPPVPGTGPLALAVDGRTGDLWLGRKGSGALVRLAGASPKSAAITTVELQGASQPIAFAFDPNGHLMTNEGGRLAAYQTDGTRIESGMALLGTAVGGVLAFPQAWLPGPHVDDPDFNRQSLPPDEYAQVTCSGLDGCATTSCGSNGVVNGSFESGAAGWTSAFGPELAVVQASTLAAANPLSPSGSMHVGALGQPFVGDAPAGIYQDVATLPGHTYELAFSYYAEPYARDPVLRVAWNGAVVEEVGAELDWRRVTYVVTATGTTTRIELDDASDAEVGNSVLLDDVTLTPDADADGVADACDNCPSVANDQQFDANDNGVGDACEIACGPCAPAGPCQAAGICNPRTGQCEYALLPDGTSCQDGDACTTGDACAGGACQAAGFLTTGACAPSCVTIARGSGAAVVDALIRSDTPTINFGASGSLTTTSTSPATTIRHALVRWETSNIPANAHVVSATATLTTLLYGGAPVAAHAVTHPWNESNVTWASFAAGEPSVAPSPVVALFPGVAVGPGPGGGRAPTPATTKADLTAIVRRWVSGAQPNHGLMLEQDATPGSTVFGTSESGTAAQRPNLTVCTTPPH